MILMQNRSVKVDDIDGGFEFNGLYLCGFSLPSGTQ